MKLAVLGSGMIVKEALPILKEINGLNLSALLSTKRSYEDAKLLAEKYDILKVYTDFDSLLEMSDCDTVYIALPNHLHFDYAKKALEAKKHIICEKPFTSTHDELVELEQLAQHNNCILLEAITTIHQPTFKLLKSQLNQLGPVRMVEINYSQYSSRYDAFKKGEIAPAFDSKKGGGALKDLNIYNIHLVVALFGEPDGVFYFPTLQKSVDTSGVLILEYKDFKAVLIAAKDSSSRLLSKIQGEAGWIDLFGSPNVLSEFKVYNRLHNALISENSYEQHRMVGEFRVFTDIIDNKDFKKSESLMRHSKRVMKVLEEASHALI